MRNIFGQKAFTGFGGAKPIKTGQVPLAGQKQQPAAAPAQQGKMPISKPKGPAAPGKSGFSDCPICH